MKKIALIGTLDTKGEEVAFLKEIIEGRGHRAIVIDIGLLGPTPFPPDIPREEVLKGVGEELDALLRLGDEGKAIEKMAEGLAEILKGLHRRGEIDGVLGIGGGQGSAICSHGMRQLPVGFPKVLVSTKVAQAGAGAYVGTRDILVLPSVADIAGLNRLTKRILSNAAGAIVGMVEGEAPQEEVRPVVTMSMLGTTTACGLRLKELLEGEGFEVVVFHAIGVGGKAMEEFIKESGAEGVIELAVNEIGNELFGGKASAGPQRMEVAGALGIPQLITPGNADFINFLSIETVPPHYRDRKLHRHNPQATTMRLNREEMEVLGRTLADKLNKASGPVKVIIPRKGFSSWDREGGVFFDPQADEGFIRALREQLSGEVELKVVDLHINDPAFAQVLFGEFKALMGRVPKKSTRR